MKNIYASIIVFSLLGFFLAYLFFGKIAGEYIGLQTIFSTKGGELAQLGRKVAGIEGIKQNIMIATGIGGVLGLILHYIRYKRK